MIDPEDTFEITDENTVEHFNCPACFKCGRLLGEERYGVPGEGGYGAWAPALCCLKCFKIYVSKEGRVW